ncbi:hypothetical protein OQY15_03565 [Pedobacter sp. MC2016-15]|uniref:hypothetical protein n=1 Tax=Pedobacter sp. MC2016-15 TaxID=2994473 RepID=UPI002247D8E2|nr:hypothetical protein [Pedobacter sp. MC2016-15]MCX2478152.1 hypothetical protein [Pedobacter sp. MC2016-15]
MTVENPYRPQPLRIFIVIGLIFLIGLKVAAPVLRVSKLFVKTVTLTPDAESEKSDKEADSDYNKNKEYYSNYNSNDHCHSWYTEVVHFSSYAIDYVSSHYYQITTPPPDSSLQSIV